MDRRNFVRRGALGASGLAAVGGSPLGDSAERGGSLLYSMDDYLAQVDAGLGRIASWTPSIVRPELADDAAGSDDLGRKILQSLYMTAMFRDLDVKDQLHPGMQRRIADMQDTMDEAFDGVNALLDRQSPQSLARVRTFLREQPELLTRIGDFLEIEGGRTGIQSQRQRRTRDTLDHVGWRLANQPPALLIEEYRGKVERLEATDLESAAYQRWMARQVGEEAFWELAQEQADLRQDRIRRGLKNMGIGAVIGIVGGIFIAIGGDALIAVGAVTVTVGSIWLLVGLVIWLVGLGT